MVRPLTIVCANDFWGTDTRFRYVQEFRHMFGEYPTGWQHTPRWAIETEQYALGLWRPRYPMPAVACT